MAVDAVKNVWKRPFGRIALLAGGVAAPVVLRQGIIAAQHKLHKGEVCFDRTPVVEYCCRPTPAHPKCYSGWPIHEVLGQGGMGSVFITCNRHKDCNYVLKLVPLNVVVELNLWFGNVKQTERAFRKEWCLAKKLASEDIAPKYVDGGVVSGYRYGLLSSAVDIGWIVTEKWDIDLLRYKARYPDLFATHRGFILDQVVTKICKLISLDISLPDIESRNIVLNLDKSTRAPKALAFIDFGNPFPNLAPTKDPMAMGAKMYYSFDSLSNICTKEEFHAAVKRICPDFLIADD